MGKQDTYGYTGYTVLNRIYKVYVCFVDYEKAFDRVNWVKLEPGSFEIHRS